MDFRFPTPSWERWAAGRLSRLDNKVAGSNSPTVLGPVHSGLFLEISLKPIHVKELSQYLSYCKDPLDTWFYC